MVQRAIRIESEDSPCRAESHAQAHDEFLPLSELPDSPWEESEAESRFADDATYLDTEDSSADGYWSDKAWSV